MCVVCVCNVCVCMCVVCVCASMCVSVYVCVCVSNYTLVAVLCSCVAILWSQLKDIFSMITTIKLYNDYYLISIYVNILLCHR